MDDLDLIGLGLDDLTEDTGTVEVVSLDEEIAKETEHPRRHPDQHPDVEAPGLDA